MTQPLPPTTPGEHWEACEPADAGLDAEPLGKIPDYMGGRGCITRAGRMVLTWGDHTKRGDVASACKPWHTHFLFRAVEDGRLASVDVTAVEYEPRLAQINAALDHKDARITFRHFATQTSCYGVSEEPGTAYCYNDYQMALFVQTLFTKVYQTPFEQVDEKVLHPLLTDPLGCEDEPTYLPFGLKDRPGRLGVSPRDFARFGLLYLRHGRWGERPLLGRSWATRAISDPLPLSIPRTTAKEAQMIPGQQSHGSKIIPDDHNDHDGSYSWLWWINGLRRDGTRFWPSAPADAAACLGHKNGMRGMALIPSLGIVMAWNDTRLASLPAQPHPLDHVLQLLAKAAQS